jgi:N-acetylglucosamine kinase-like BadF-type ATPase
VAGVTAAVLAIDGGNSKTDVALVAADGTVLAAARGAGSCHQNIGLDRTRSLLTDLVAKAAAAAGLDPAGPVAGHAAVYLAGADLPVEVGLLTQTLADTGWAPSMRIDNDTFALLRTGTSSPDAVAVVCGAGINCVGVAADGRTARFPALGRLTGDWGGGAALGEEALWWATRAEDGRGEPTALEGAVAHHFGVASPMAVSEAIHFGQIGPGRLIELTPVLMDVARGGDRVALRLVERLADEVCLFATVALRRLGLLQEAPDVVLGGGVLTGSGAIVLDRIAERLAVAIPGAQLRLATEPPVVGAALLGLDFIGAEPGAEPTVRAALTAAVRAAQAA